MTVRVATYNVRGMRDSVPALVRVIAALRADVLCLQEAPGPLHPRGGRTALARACGMRVAAASPLAGVAVLAGPRCRVLHAEGRVLRFFAGLQVRALAVAVVEVDGTRLAVGSVHLDLHGGARLRHAAEIMSVMRRVSADHGAAVVLGGDINEQAHQPAWRYLAAQLVDCHPASGAGDGFTFSARRPRMRIDALFVASGTRVLSCAGAGAGEGAGEGAREGDAAGRGGGSGADPAAASDHLPVVAELETGG
ncbi:endonuclease/exonuclease/phosphatase family protein [Nonomuraea sp. NPDC047897]|uniref:endonuclease/exonuclease/phosphatase family protein n=1 Tax=Nonomuraea sp. NPDC047897 TaxID=3364346 RepID=UPI00371EC1E1